MRAVPRRRTNERFTGRCRFWRVLMMALPGSSLWGEVAAPSDVLKHHHEEVENGWRMFGNFRFTCIYATRPCRTRFSRLPRGRMLLTITGRSVWVCLQETAMTPVRSCLPFLVLAALAAQLPAAEPLPRVPPTEPKDVGAKFHTKHGFTMDLLAAEPLTTDPVAITYDENGRA